MTNDSKPMDQDRFFLQFDGIEDVAFQAIDAFLEALPEMLNSIEIAIEKNCNSDLERAAHTLKGALSNFYAEPSRLNAWRLEEMGHSGEIDQAKSVFFQLVSEVDKLKPFLAGLRQQKCIP